MAELDPRVRLQALLTEYSTRAEAIERDLSREHAQSFSEQATERQNDMVLQGLLADARMGVQEVKQALERLDAVRPQENLQLRLREGCLVVALLSKRLLSGDAHQHALQCGTVPQHIVSFLPPVGPLVKGCRVAAAYHLRFGPVGSLFKRIQVELSEHDRLFLLERCVQVQSAEAVDR